MTKKHDTPHEESRPHDAVQDAPQSTPDDIAQEEPSTASSPNETPLTKMEQLEMERNDAIDHLRRLQAEFDNFRKRTERTADEQRAAANDGLIKELLTIVDTFELSLHHAKDDSGAVRSDDLYQGLLLIHDQLKHLLEAQGLEPIPTDGRFDPRQHEVLMTVHQEGVERGMIIAQIQQGYQRGGRVIRPAKVSVAK